MKLLKSTKIAKVFIMLGITGGLACSKKKDDDEPAIPNVVEATQDVNALAVGIGLEYGKTLALDGRGLRNLAASEMSSSQFTTVAFPAFTGYDSTGDVSPSDWAGQVMNPKGRNPDSDYGYFKTFFGRLLSNMDSVCVAAYLMDGIVKEGEYESKLTADNVEEINTACGTSFNADLISEGYPKGKPFVMTVTSVADAEDSNFNEKLFIQSGKKGTEDYREETIFVRVNDGLVRLMLTEKANNYDDEIIRSIVDLNRDENVLRFEYVESYDATGSQRITEVYRAHIESDDGTTDSGAFTALARYKTEGTREIILGLKGDKDEEVGATFTATGTTVTFENAQLCVNQETGDHIAAGKCPDSKFAVDLDNVANVFEVVDETAFKKWNFDETVNVPDFSATEIFTAPITNP